jgi:DNA replication and repair protein RecF
MQSMPDKALIKHGSDMLMVRGNYTMDSGAEECVSCGIVSGKGKTLRRNDKEYQRISEHIGKFPIVSVTPSDSELVTGTGETRRRLMDMVISQADPAYLSLLIRYNRGLESRNKMLRAGVADKMLYESVEAGMAIAADAIHAARLRWCEEIVEPFSRYYTRISGDAERSSLAYKSVLNERRLLEVFETERGHDLALGFTSAGIHRDDLAMYIGDYSMRRLGSQGQVKTFTIALRLAIFEFLKRSGGVTPILLLDDIFDKLDATRVARIMEIVGEDDTFGQIFITDTNREHLDETLAGTIADTRLFEVKDGEFIIIERQ